MAFKVTPWEVSGKLKYDELIETFGLDRISDATIKRIEKLAGETHFMLERKVFMAHRDLNWILNEYEKGNKFYLYTGRGPSGKTHLGHVMPWIFTKWLQDKLGVKLLFQFTDDEKYYFKKDITEDQVADYAHENMLDVIAMGFDPKKTDFIVNTKHARTIYPRAMKVAKKINFSMIKAVFGLTNDSNVGMIFYTSMQTVPSFLESDFQGKNVPCLIPHAVDQDPHFRISRDVLPKLGYYKPASIQCRFLPGLSGDGKLSSSEGTAIYLDDDGETVKKKINKYAFSGGKESVEEHRKHGGNPDIDVSFQYLKMMFEPDDKKLKQIEDDYRSGKLLTGELKTILIEKINAFLKEHQKRRESAESKLNDFLLKEK